MNRITDVVKNLMIINVIVFLAKMILPGLGGFFRQYFVFYPIGTSYFSPVQIITNMFNHADVNHLVFNMLGLFFLGPYLEQAIGPKKFLFLYLMAGLGGVFLHQMFGTNPILGASGCVLGVVVAFGTKFPNLDLMLLFIPVPIKAKYLVSAYVAYDLIMVYTQSNTGIAHFAHLGGALVGFGLMMLWRKYPNFMA